MSEAELQPVVPQPSIRWFHPTPGRLVLALLAVEVLLWLSEGSAGLVGIRATRC